MTLRSSQKRTVQLLNRKQYCCLIRINMKTKKKVFVNVTNLKGQTIIKFISSSGKRTLARGRLHYRLAAALGGNFDYIKIFIASTKAKSCLHLKAFLKKKRLFRPKVVYLKSRSPVVHNGCRPPSVRRV